MNVENLISELKTLEETLLNTSPTDGASLKSLMKRKGELEKIINLNTQIEEIETQIADNQQLSSGKDNEMAELAKDGKKLFIKVQGPANVEMKTWSTTSPNDYDAPNPGTTLVGFETLIPKGSKASFTVFLIPEKVLNKVNPGIKSLQDWNK